MTPRLDALCTDDGRRLWAATIGHGPITTLVPNGATYAADLAPAWTGRSALVYDLRNRGASETETDEARLARGIGQDVEDLEAVRRHAGLDAVDLLAHSYVGVIAVAYAVAHPTRVRRLVLLGTPGYGIGLGAPPPPDPVALEVFQALGAVLRESPPDADPQARCTAVWRVLRRLYVADPALADRLDWDRCAHPNERAFLTYWMTTLEPSLRQLTFTADDLARIHCPVLVIQGDRDRSADPAAARAWAARLPRARLLMVPGVAHAPWIEAPDVVLPAMATFLDGAWPPQAAAVAAG